MIEEHVLPSGQQVRFDKDNHTYHLYGYDLEWHKVPSVTTILNVYHKPALVWWGMQVGVGAVLTCIENDDMIVYEGQDDRG